MKLLINCILLSLFSQVALACQELIWTPTEYALKSEKVYIGLVQSMSLNKEIAGKAIEIKTYSNSLRSQHDPEITLKVVKSLKGKSQSELKVNLNWCRGGQYELGDLVAVYKLGEYWHVKNSKAAVEQTIQALTSGSM